MVQRLTEEADVVTISYDELLDGSCDLHRIEQAFGADSLGFLTVSGIPGLLELRNRMLLLAQEFADLPDEVKRNYEDPRGGAASVGWTRGAESLEDGRPDLNKGSYYANPLMDSVTTDPALLKRFPSYTTPNVDWPDTHLPDFRPTFQKLGRLILEVGLLLARQCDRYVASRLPSFPQGHLEGVLARSLNPKGRLLHYYPSQPDEVKAGHWCTQHTDHGSLTGLLSALYTRDGREVRNPDPTSGLYITGRGGASIKAPIPPSHLAFQVGEAMQVHSGGLLRATPHFVQTAGGPNAAGVARNTLAVFLQPRWDEAMDLPAGTDASTVGIGQWQEGITFGEFSELTVRKNYSKSE